jgi:hypothetical protein
MRTELVCWLGILAGCLADPGTAAPAGSAAKPAAPELALAPIERRVINGTAMETIATPTTFQSDFVYLTNTDFPHILAHDGWLYAIIGAVSDGSIAIYHSPLKP